MRAQVDFAWKDPEGFPRLGQGFTRDITPSAMFVYTNSHPPENADIYVQVFLPPFAEGEPPLRLSAQARVLRVDAVPGEPQAGFVAVSMTLILHNTNTDVTN